VIHSVKIRDPATWPLFVGAKGIRIGLMGLKVVSTIVVRLKTVRKKVEASQNY
jgi:hypothetical protein